MDYESFNIKWKRGKEIKKGVVYEVANKPGTHILKATHFTEKGAVTKFKKSLEIQNKAAQKGYSIPVDDVWTGFRAAAFVMKRLQMSLEEYMVDLDAKSKLACIKASAVLLNNLEAMEIYHRDFHLNNVMVDEHAYGENPVKIEGTNKYLYIIDFDRAVEGPAEEHADDFVKDAYLFGLVWMEELIHMKV